MLNIKFILSMKPYIIIFKAKIRYIFHVLEEHIFENVDTNISPNS